MYYYKNITKYYYNIIVQLMLTVTIQPHRFANVSLLFLCSAATIKLLNHRTESSFSLFWGGDLFPWKYFLTPWSRPGVFALEWKIKREKEEDNREIGKGLNQRETETKRELKRIIYLSGIRRKAHIWNEFEWQGSWFGLIGLESTVSLNCRWVSRQTFISRNLEGCLISQTNI